MTGSVLIATVGAVGVLLPWSRSLGAYCRTGTPAGVVSLPHRSCSDIAALGHVTSTLAIGVVLWAVGASLAEVTATWSASSRLLR